MLMIGSPIRFSGKKLQTLLDKIVLESSKRGLTINFKKTERLVVSKRKEIPQCVLKIGDNVIKNTPVQLPREYNYKGWSERNRNQETNWHGKGSFRETGKCTEKQEIATSN